MKKFFMGIFYTVRGLFDAVLSDIYLRLEMATATIIIFFAYAFDLERAEWAILGLAVMAVLGMQFINTAIRKSVTENGEADKYKSARYIASAGSAVVAAGAMFVCLCLFYDKEKIKWALLNLRYSPHALTYLTILFIFDVLFVAWFERPKRKKNKGEMYEKQK
jgi:diacylglycerol kinase